MATHAEFCFALLALSFAGTALAWDAGCISAPVGFGRGTVGGEGGRVVYPKTIKQLKNYLKDDVPRIIYLDKTYDFTGTEGMTTSRGCYFLECGAGFQYSLAESDTCDGRRPTSVTYDAAGVKPLNVGSYKTIIGVGGKGVIKGKGLKLRNAKNVIIKDISIVDINPDVIWGGDALTFNAAEKVWIHNVTFARVGRQFIVTYQKANTGITISSCTFDGVTPNSPYCDHSHYWVWLFWGTDDRITLVNNRILHTSGRLPHAGGWGGSKNFIHIVGNVFDGNTNTAIEPFIGSTLLVEGNTFKDMREIYNKKAQGGNLFLANDGADLAACAKVLGEPCLPNRYANTGVERRDDAQVLRDAADRGADAVNDARAAAKICSVHLMDQ